MPDLLFQSKQERLPDGSPIIINGSPVIMTKVSGAIDGTTVRKFEEKLVGFFNQGVKYLILDFKDVKYINSTGMGLLVKLADKFQENGGALKLIGIPEKVIALFDMLGLLSIFPIYETVEQALSSILRESEKSSAPPPPPPPPSPSAPPPASAGFTIGSVDDTSGGFTIGSVDDTPPVPPASSMRRITQPQPEKLEDFMGGGMVISDDEVDTTVTESGETITPDDMPGGMAISVDINEASQKTAGKPKSKSPKRKERKKQDQDKKKKLSAKTQPPEIITREPDLETAQDLISLDGIAKATTREAKFDLGIVAPELPEEKIALAELELSEEEIASDRFQKVVEEESVTEVEPLKEESVTEAEPAIEVAKPIVEIVLVENEKSPVETEVDTGTLQQIDTEEKEPEAPVEQKLPKFEKWLSDDAGNPKAIERLIAKSRTILFILQKTIGVSCIVFINLIDNLLDLVTGYVNSIYQAWKTYKTIEKRMKLKNPQHQADAIIVDLQIARDKLSQLLHFPGYESKDFQVISVLPLELVLDTRAHLDQMKRDLAIINAKETKKTVTKTTLGFLKSFIPNPLEIFPVLKDFFIIAFVMKYSSEEIEQMYIDFVIAYENILSILAKNNNFSIDIVWQEYEKQIFEKSTNHYQPVNKENVDSCIGECRHKVQRLIQMLCNPKRYVKRF